MAKETPAPDPALFSYDAGAISYHLRQVASRADYDLFELTYTSPLQTEYANNNTVWAWYYRPHLPAGAQVPAVVVLDVLKSSKASIARSFCTRLARVGMSGLIVALPYHMQRTPPGFGSGALAITADPAHLRQFLRQAVMDVRAAVDWLAQQPEVDSRQIGLVGFSLGAIITTLAAQVEPRLRAAVPVLGAADPAGIVEHSVLTYRIRTRQQQAGVSSDQLRQELAAVDATNYAGHNPNVHIYMINAAHDSVIPGALVRATHQALGEPALQWLNAGHYTTFANRGAVFDEVLRFLQAAFGPNPDQFRPHTVGAINLKVGVLYGAREGLAPAALWELAPLDRHQKLALDFGWVGDNAWAGLSGRVLEHFSVGVGTPLFQGGLQGQVYGMAHVTF